MRALFLVALAAMAQADTPGHPVEGLWGFALADDMTCAANPVQIKLSDDRRNLVFSWPKSVEYSDGTASDGVSFSILAVDGLRLTLRRDRDGIGSTITVTPDGMAFQYEEDGPTEGSRFDRCDDLAS